MGAQGLRTISFKIGILMISLVVAGLIAEVVVRLGKLAPEVAVIQQGRYRLSANEKLGYEPTPGLYYEGDDLNYYDYRGAETNRLGYRDYDHKLAKPADTIRVVVLGDSIAAGYGIEAYSDTFPAILETELRSRNIAGEVINFGVSGYNTQQEVETLKMKGLDFSPDFVLLAYCLNDRIRSDGEIMRKLLEREEADPGISFYRLSPWLVRSALFRWVRYSVLANVGGEERSGQTLDARWQTVSEDTVEAYFAKLRDIAQARGFRVLVAVFPVFVEGDYTFHEEHLKVGALSRRQGFLHLDLLDAFQRCREQAGQPINIDHLHPSALGHRCAAQAMAQIIAGELGPTAER